MVKGICAGLVLAGASLLLAQSASAQGLDFLHTQRAEGGRWCFSDHSHAGLGSGSTKAAAERDAIANYSGFTAFEYGNAWGSWQLAAAKSMDCSAGGVGWSCSISARPCKPIGAGSGRRAPRPQKPKA